MWQGAMCDSGGVCCGLQNSTWNDWIPSSARAALKTLNSVQEEVYVSSLLGLCLMSRIPSAQKVERRPVRKRIDWEVT